MIKKLQFKFIALSMMALFILLSVIIAGINLINYNTIVAEADKALSMIAQNGGVFPDFKDFGKKGRNGPPPNISPEAPYETRYFSVLLDTGGEVIRADTGKIKAVDTQQAIDYAVQILFDNRSRGFIDSYRFICHSEGSQTHITFLDCGRKMNSFYTFLFISIGMAFTGYLVFFFVILFFSGKIVRPAAESNEKQKCFITDAGHEIKTPLTIIQADVDVLEMEFGENEWLTDIQKQTKRLTLLTNDLIYLSRMEEADDSIQMIEFPISDLVSETAMSFQTLAQTQGKTLQCQIQPMLSLVGNEKAIHQLVNILLDNALKYAPGNSTIFLTLKKQNKVLQLSVCNTTKSIVPKEKLHMLFERFYRMDSSHSSRTGGHGIGLSIAKAIVTAHRGKIQAKTDDGHSLQITATFPI